MRETRTRLEGARELDRFLKRLPHEMRQKELEGSLMTASNILRKAFMEAAAGRARQEPTGYLERNVSRVKMRRSQYSAQVIVGWFRRGFYAVFEEERLPFARPAWDRVSGEVLDGIGKALGQRLERAARKLAGSQAIRAGRRTRGGRRR